MQHWCAHISAAAIFIGCLPGCERISARILKVFASLFHRTHQFSNAILIKTRSRNINVYFVFFFTTIHPYSRQPYRHTSVWAKGSDITNAALMGVVKTARRSGSVSNPWHKSGPLGQILDQNIRGDPGLPPILGNQIRHLRHKRHCEVRHFYIARYRSLRRDHSQLSETTAGKRFCICQLHSNLCCHERCTV